MRAGRCLQQNAKSPEIGILIDKAMATIERDNPTLKGVLPSDYGRADLDKRRLGELIDLIGTIALGDKQSRSQDLLGRVYEYFIGQFATLEAKKGGQFYTPTAVVRLLVQMLEPYKGRVYDPCCGSGGMFVQSERFTQVHGGKIGDISVFGQESNPATWKLAKMNLAIRGIDCNLGSHAADSFHHNSETLEEIQGHGYVMTPGRYVGAAAQDEDAEPFAEKMARLTAQLQEQFAESARLEQVITDNLRRIGYAD